MLVAVQKPFRQCAILRPSRVFISSKVLGDAEYIHTRLLSSAARALLVRTDPSPLTSGFWEIHAGCACFCFVCNA